MLTIIGGPMFAGKTTYLIDFANKLPHKSYLFFKPNIDTRYSTNKCVTHNGQSIKAVNLNSTDPVFPAVSNQIKSVFIDELNFFKYSAIKPQIKKLLKKGINVIAAGLLYDSNKKPFGATLPLSKQADEFIQLYAVCDFCGKRAEHSYSKVIKEKQIELGAADKYGPCCSKCHPQQCKTRSTKLEIRNN
jgi:thymidine kinase